MAKENSDECQSNVAVTKGGLVLWLIGFPGELSSGNVLLRQGEGRNGSYDYSRYRPANDP